MYIRLCELTRRERRRLNRIVRKQRRSLKRNDEITKG